MDSMKRLFLIIILQVLCKNVYSQIADNTTVYNDKNIYFQALSHFLKFRTSELGSHLKKDLDSIYIFNDKSINDSLLPGIGTSKIIVVDEPLRFISRTKVGCATIFRIFPLEFRHQEFSISLVPFSVCLDSRNKKKIFT